MIIQYSSLPLLSDITVSDFLLVTDYGLIKTFVLIVPSSEAFEQIIFSISS